MTPEQYAADLEHRRRLEEEGLAGTILVEPLTALAGGILGGVAVSVVAWRLAWAQRRTPLYVRVRQLRRIVRRT